MDKLAKDINDNIKNSFVYKRYVACKQNVENNIELRELENKMKELKNKNCKDKNDELINEYYEIEKIYKSSVIVKEYQRAKEELYILLSDISDILTFK